MSNRAIDWRVKGELFRLRKTFYEIKKDEIRAFLNPYYATSTQHLSFPITAKPQFLGAQREINLSWKMWGLESRKL